MKKMSLQLEFSNDLNFQLANFTYWIYCICFVGLLVFEEPHEKLGSKKVERE